MQCSIARHSELVIIKFHYQICVPRSGTVCQTSNSVASPHRKWQVGQIIYLVSLYIIEYPCIDIVCMQNIGARAARQYSHCPNHMLVDIDIALHVTAYNMGFSESAQHFEPPMQ